MRNELAEILKGVLLFKRECITFISYDPKAGEFVLVTITETAEGFSSSGEIICRHENWNDFVAFVEEISDYRGNEEDQ